MSAFFSFLVISGDLLGIGLAFSCIVLCLFVRSEIITPEQYQSERVAAAPAGPGEFEPDKAWPLYPFRQARTDLLRVGAETARRYQQLWTWPVDAFFRGFYGSRLIWWFFFPIPLSVLFILVTGGVAALATYALFALVTMICIAATLIVLGAVAGTLRGAENYRRRVMRTDASCPQCYHVTPWPAYQCPGCPDKHHDMRPGRLGLFWRRCQCDTMLPTMPVRAAWQLKASCQRCQAELPTGSGAVRDVRIPILGDPSAGKTRFLYAALDSLISTTDRDDVAYGYPDGSSKDAAEKALTLIRSGDDTPKTSSTLPPPFSIQLGLGKQQTLVHMFDTAGEILRNPEMHDALGFLGLGHGLVYILDPFSIGPVRDRLTGHNMNDIQLAVLAAGDPENAFNETVSRLRDSGVKAKEQRLAVVISKIDLLRKAGLEDIPQDSGDIADWLKQASVHNLVLGARRDFADVRYFTVASQAFSALPHDPGVPLRWLLRAHGVRLPPDRAGGTAGQPRDDQQESRQHRRQGGIHDEAAETT